MAAVLANWGGYYSQRVYLSEARRIGLKVRPPHINHSGRNFVVDNVDEGLGSQKILFMGLDQVRDLTGHTIERIILGRPFHSIEDFLARANPRAQEAENLAKVGALAGLGTIRAILQHLKQGAWQPGQMSLFAWDVPAVEDWTMEQKMTAQQELLGASLEAHPLELVAAKIKAAGAITTLEALGHVGQRVTVAGIRQSSHRSKTAKGDSMMFLSLEDLSGMLDVIFFPDVYRRARADLGSTTPILVTGSMELDDERSEPYLRAEKVTRLA
jgi:DNA polymerase III alpha subunit